MSGFARSSLSGITNVPDDDLHNTNYLLALNEANKCCKKSNRWLSKHLLLPLSRICISVAQTLFMNKCEINKIIRTYLMMWNKDRNITAIPIGTFLMPFPECTHGIIRNFFPLRYVSYKKFFIFVTLFLFYDVDLILSLLLTLSDINTNLIISFDQIKVFLEDYGIDIKLLCEIMQRKQENSFSNLNQLSVDTSDDAVTLKDFKLMCYQEPTFLKILFRLKTTLKMMMFTDMEMINLKNKFSFYFTHPKLAETRGELTNGIKTKRNASNKSNLASSPPYLPSARLRGESLNNNNNNINILLDERADSDVLHPSELQATLSISSINSNKNKHSSVHNIDDDTIPAEPCLHCLFRHLINYSSPPYSYDYGLENPQYKDLEEIILIVRHLYGYSIRKTDQRQLGRAVKNYIKNM